MKTRTNFCLAIKPAFKKMKSKFQIVLLLPLVFICCGCDSLTQTMNQEYNQYQIQKLQNQQATDNFNQNLKSQQIIDDSNKRYYPGGAIPR